MRPGKTPEHPQRTASTYLIGVRAVKAGPFDTKTPEIAGFPGFLAFIKLRSALAELRSAAGSLEAVLVPLVAGNSCIYLVFGILHPRFPHSLTTGRCLFSLLLFQVFCLVRRSNRLSEAVCSLRSGNRETLFR